MPTWQAQVSLVSFPDSTFGLAALVKRTYAFAPTATPSLRLADEQLPLIQVPVADDEGLHGLLDDTDDGPPKRCTDVVVMGHVYGRGASEVFASVAAGKMARRIRASGVRRVEVRTDGTARFSSPAPFERVRLSPRHAYGGIDAYAQELLAPLPPAFLKDPDERPYGPFAYARNEFGTSYFVDVDRSRADGALLPQLEDPLDPVLPERFFLPEPEQWIDAPIAASLGWVHYTCYPRLYRFVGPVLVYAPPRRPIREATFPDGDDLDKPWQPEGDARILPRALQGASPGLACERLRGDEMIILENLHPTQPEVRFSLPGEAPQMTLRPPDLKPFPVQTVLQTVRIEPDEGRVSLLFCGAVPMMAPAPQAWIDRVELDVSWKRL